MAKSKKNRAEKQTTGAGEQSKKVGEQPEETGEQSEETGGKPKKEYLSGEQMKTLDLFEARAEMQRVVLENTDLRMGSVSTEYQNKMAAFKAKKRATNNSLQKIREDYNQFVAELEAEFGIRMKDYSIEEDGYLTYNPLPIEPPEEVPEE